VPNYRGKVGGKINAVVKRNTTTKIKLTTKGRLDEKEKSQLRKITKDTDDKRFIKKLKSIIQIDFLVFRVNN
jgi:hypothetical protein